ncbi:MAG: hypothetical protein WC796_01250 [Candidatus Pacearchaeota archaeon]|jgi:hypothetical protein
MRQIKGYVCAARVDRDPFVNVKGKKFRDYILFGRKVNKTDGPWENLESNGLTTYETLQEAEIGQASLVRRNLFDLVEIRELELVIAENREENDSFEDERSLVVIWKNDMGERMIGRNTGGKGLYPLYGDFITQNGFKPYQEFKMADYSRSEATRQSGNCPATLARFRISPVLSRMKKIKKKGEPK